MNGRVIELPSSDHPITIERNRNRVVVTLGGPVIADTGEALTLREASYPPVQYIPRKDVDLAALTRSETTTYVPLQGRGQLFQYPGWRKAVD